MELSENEKRFENEEIFMQSLTLCKNRTTADASGRIQTARNIKSVFGFLRGEE